MTVEEKLAAALAELGDTADQVADRLRALGIKGRRKDATCCPVANYLDRWDWANRPHVGADTALVEADRGLPIEVDTPDSVAGFVEAFDRGVYLDLVETS